MRSTWSALVRLALVLLAPIAPLAVQAADVVLGFPSGNTKLVTVHDADDLSLVTTIPAPANSFDALRTLDGDKYYIVVQSSRDTILSVDAESYLVLNQFDLNTSPSAAEITPDGRYLLVAAGTIRVIDTETDEEMASVPVGGQPTQILIDDTSTRAYVLAQSGNAVHILNLETLEIDRTLDTTNASSIALTPNNARLLVSELDGVHQYRTRDFSEAQVAEGIEPHINAILHPIPNSVKVLVQNRGAGAASTSEYIDLDTGEAKSIGQIGLTKLSRVVVVDQFTAFAINETERKLIEIAFDQDDHRVDVASPAYGADAVGLDLSPNGRFLYVSSTINATLTKVNLQTGLVEQTAPTQAPLTNHRVIYAPSTRPPAQIQANGGTGQYFPPGTTLPIPYSVIVTDAQGYPVPNVPVYFEGPIESGITFSPEQPSMTNARGVATAIVSIPPDPDEPEPEEPEEEDLDAPEPDLLETLTLSATAPGLDPALFELTIIRGTGFIKISGDYQVARPGEPFPKEIVVLATDEFGQPLSQETNVSFAADAGAACGQTANLEAIVDPDGLIHLRCQGNQFPANSSLFALAGRITFTVPELQPRVLPVGFSFSVMGGGVRFDIAKLGGDNQTGPTGSKLTQPLSFKIFREIGFGSPSNGVLVELTQVSGPPVEISRRRVITNVERDEEVEITLGPNAGTSVIKAEASMTGLPAVFFTVNATGGQPVSLEKSNDGQIGRILNPLATPLRVQVRNESGNLVPFPDVTWRVLSGDATIDSTKDQSGSNGYVNFGATPGQVQVLAAIGNLQTTFTVTSEPPQPASISTFSGQNQTVTTGILSDPLVVRVNEITNEPAAGAVVTFSGPPTVRLHPLNGSAPGNPVQVPTDSDGLAGVRVELRAVGAAALSPEGVTPEQLTSTVTIGAEVGPALSTSFLMNVVGRTPEISTQGVVNAASFQAGLTPGGLVTLFGTGMMEGVLGAEDAQGATSYKGTQVRIGGVPAPLFGLSTTNGEQINLQAPFELTPGQTTTIEVENNGSRSTISNVPVFRAQPGIFEIFPASSGGSVVAAVHANGGLVTPDTPASPGEVIAMFYTGGGKLAATSGVATGALGPVPAAPLPLPTVVGIDNGGVPVLFSGYAPGFIGLYQVNFQVPADATCGLRSISLMIGDSSSGNSTLPIRCP